MTSEHAVTRRPASQVMRLERLGSFHQSRLSFMRILTRRLARERWRFERREFTIDSQGVGRAVYTLHGPARSYSLVAFAHDLPDEQRSDRVIADAWDATFALFDGCPDPQDLTRLAANVPLQEAGRISASELSLSRANRSMRVWEHVVTALSRGKQPDPGRLADVGYLMRTTAVYGSGKFGAADRSAIAERSEFTEPFQVEMLTVYLIRTFVRDLVEHIAHERGGPEATTMDEDIAESLGIGNSTGLGMAPFILNHPTLLSRWITAREEAISRVRSISTASPAALALFRQLLQGTVQSVAHWHTDHATQQQQVVELSNDLERLGEQLDLINKDAEGKTLQPWDRLYTWAEAHLGIEAQECLASLLLEPYPELVDPLCETLSSSRSRTSAIDGSISVAATRDDIDRVYAWARDIDWTSRDAIARVWYVSEEKLEPRLGERFEEPVAEYEQPLAPARDAIALRRELDSWPGEHSIADVLAAHPEHRHTVRRIQLVAREPYAEICDNTIAAHMQPLDMLRCKLSFFGATHFDPRSDRWVRIRLFADAPYPSQLLDKDADRWIYPSVDTTQDLCSTSAA